MSATWLRLRWLFSLRVAKVLLWLVLIILLALAANIAGIYFIGSIAGWEQWLAAVSVYFLIGRLCIYGTVIYGWIWMRRRLLSRETHLGARHRLVRTEIAGVLAIMALEASLLMQAE